MEREAGSRDGETTQVGRFERRAIHLIRCFLGCRRRLGTLLTFGDSQQLDRSTPFLIGPIDKHAARGKA